MLQTEPVTTRNLLGDLPPTLLPDDATSREALDAGTAAGRGRGRAPRREPALGGARGGGAGRRPHDRGVRVRTRRLPPRASTPCAAPAGAGRARCRGRTSPTAASCVRSRRSRRRPPPIGEDVERDRCRQFVADCDPEAARVLLPAAGQPGGWSDRSPHQRHARQGGTAGDRHGRRRRRRDLGSRLRAPAARRRCHGPRRWSAATVSAGGWRCAPSASPGGRTPSTSAPRTSPCRTRGSRRS